MILTNYLIGFIEDTVGLFALPRVISGLKGCTDFVGYPTGSCQDLWVSNQPFILIPAFLLARLVDPVLVYNLIVLGGTALNFFFAFRFFKKLFGRFIAVLLATIFLFSPYFAYQGRSHFDLIQFWPVIWFVDTLFFSKSRHKVVFLGLLLTLITGISNYLGYFTLLFILFYLIFYFLTSAGKLLTLKKRCPDIAKGAAVFALSSLLFMAPYVKSNFFSPRIRLEDSVDNRAVNRPFEDFITFSSRPWYYLLPSVDNPFIGGLSQKVLGRLSGGGNYLAQNYFKAEHSASYLGWMNILLALVGLAGRTLCRPTDGQESGTHPEDSKHSTKLINYPALLLTIIGLILLTMPPSIVVNGATIYTPSYLLFKFFPMFRVLARMGVLVLFLILIFTGYGYSVLLSGFLADRQMGRRAGPVRRVAGIRKMHIFTAVFLALFSVAEFFTPLKVTHVGTPPKVYAYIATTDPLKSPIVVYPYNKTNEALFWMTTYKQPLINPKMHEDKETNFVSEDFTNLLTTSRGLEKAQQMGAKYLVYFYEDDRNKNIDFFNSSQLIIRIDGFKETDPEEHQITIPEITSPERALLRIVEAGSAVTNSAILYKFR